jgi:hypothetical protein
MFSEQTDLQIEIRALVSLLRHAVLRNQHEGREEDCFDRCEHRRHHKTRIKFRQGHVRQVHDDPRGEEDEVNVHERQTASEAGDRIGDAQLQRLLFFLGFASLENRVDVAPHDFGHSVGGSKL